VTRNRILTLLVGVYFGIVLVKSEVVSWFRIHEMFRFESPYMYLVIASAIVVGALSVWIIRRSDARTIDGEKIEIQRKPFQKGIVFGGTIFGMGWAITGACPGPIYAQMGAGTLMAVVTFIGALVGMYLYAFLQPRLAHDSWRLARARAERAGSQP
jgi:uncharacterized membrane protein YedE/YeeE